MGYVLKDGKGMGVCVYSSCNDVVYAQAEVLLLGERQAISNPDSKIIAFFDKVDDLPVMRFLESYKGRPKDLARLEELRKGILEKGWPRFYVRVES